MSSPGPFLLFLLGVCFFSGLFVSLCATVCLFPAFSLAGLSIDYWLLGFVFSGSLGLYALDRSAVFSPEDRQYDTPRARWTRRYGRWLLLVPCLCFGYCIVQLRTLQASGIGFIIVLGLFSSLYVLPLIPWRKRWVRIKELVPNKAAYIAMNWALLTAYLPAVNAIGPREILNPKLGILCALQMWLVYLCALIFDCRDVDGDAARKIPTLPVRLGVSGALQRVRVGAVSLAIVALAAAFFLEIGVALGFAVAGLWLVGACFVYGRLPIYAYYYIVVDGVMTFPALGGILRDFFG